MSQNCREGLVSSSVGLLGPAIFSELNVWMSFVKGGGLVSEKRPERKEIKPRLSVEISHSGKKL